MQGSILLSELLLILFRQRLRPRTEVRERPHREEQARRRPREYRISNPFDELSEIVRARYIFVHTLFRNIVLRVARFAEMADDVVRIEVYRHSREEDDRSDDKARVAEPGKSVISLRCLGFHESRDSENPAGYEKCVHGVKHHAHEHYGNRRRALSPHQKREYERAQKALQFLEEQIREVKNRIQGTEKRNLPRP